MNHNDNLGAVQIFETQIQIMDLTKAGQTEHAETLKNQMFADSLATIAAGNAKDPEVMAKVVLKEYGDGTAVAGGTAS